MAEKLDRRGFLRSLVAVVASTTLPRVKAWGVNLADEKKSSQPLRLGLIGTLFEPYDHANYPSCRLRRTRHGTPGEPASRLKVAEERTGGAKRGTGEFSFESLTTDGGAGADHFVARRRGRI